MKTTMKGFATNDKADYYSGITSITVNGKNAYELKGKFLDDLHNNAFSGTNGEDAIEHIEYFLKIVDPIDLPNEAEVEPTNEKTLNLEETNQDDEQEIGENFRIKTKLFDYETPLKREYENEHEDEERCELFELSVCTVRRFEMIKYSFGQDEEYVAIKEDEYEDLTSTSEDACRAYQEIFRMIDEGWMATRAE
ncbi:hypothetical protein Tco_1221276 [Tanacetum coccineum]